ncbi:hypothetical protein KAI58_02180 [Candidatus Gracilibacteria bacterium]|nr:hypothetical protein [Candidatus Gracilibacteria bacterium]
MKEKETVKNAKKRKLLSTQRYLEFAGVHNDTLVLKNGGIRAILEVSSVNFNLKSEEEQNSIIYSYQRFLNGLNFPVQILMRSRKLDIDHYLDDLRDKLRHQQNELLKNQMGEYIEYISKLVEYADIMEKRFFVVIPQNPSRAEKTSIFASFLEKISPDDKVMNVIQRRKEFKTLKKGLDERVNVVKTGLENCGLSVTRVNTGEIIEIFYQCYNPQHSRTQKMRPMEEMAVSGNPEDELVVDDK